MSGSSKRLSEASLKCLYLQSLREHGLIDETSIIASEYLLGHTGRRVDLAFLTNEFVGIEFKSKGDSLKRLQPQLDAYVSCFDRVVLVVDERHTRNVFPSLPDSVELWSVNAKGRLFLERQGMSPLQRSTRALAQLCPTRQLRKLAPIAETSSASRSKLVDAASSLPFDRVREAAVASFKSTFGASSAAFWNYLASEELGSSALAILSRFADLKQKKTSALRAQNEFWTRWAEEAAVVFGSSQGVSAVPSS
ncbi:hypothetical protein ACVIW2_002106 [Bradyrhizobium huanghuaihaiense]